MLAALILLLDLVGSFAVTMVQPSNSPFGVRAVEWLRDNGAAWLVSDVEHVYYSLQRPLDRRAATQATAERRRPDRRHEGPELRRRRRSCR